MRFPWSKQNRAAADEEATSALLKELMEVRQSPLSPQDALAELIKIGNRDLGIDERTEANAAPKAQPDAPAPPSEGPTSHDDSVVIQAAVTPDESLSGLSLEELVGLLGGSDSELEKES